MNWTKETVSLLLYLETCAVDHGGIVDSRRMNAADMELVMRLEEEGFLHFGRLLSRYIKDHSTPRYRCTHWVELTDQGWSRAGAERRARALRNPVPMKIRTVL